MAKKVKRDKFYSSKEVGIITGFANIATTAAKRRNAGLFAGDEVLEIDHGKRITYYYKGVGILRVFFGIDVKNTKHLELLK